MLRITPPFLSRPLPDIPLALSPVKLITPLKSTVTLLSRAAIPIALVLITALLPIFNVENLENATKSHRRKLLLTLCLAAS